ncbi:RICIN domain-containing protein [Micromonospora soli]|uniref:RICIN domain-containing protein n=1 Tax=Micromonospora sp. NBRC 110009 TaxID=3061627 RepID=UPI0026714B42|nr:RICIN domain-containing protein [Micromonospora sp. NBRC 110009]WKT99980.1 RICIN domain-containing protein [Micromonospora sp. NBRC 110009]
MSDPRTDPPGTVYAARRTGRPGLPQDPLMRIALGVAVLGVLLGVFFATGVLGGGSDQPVVPAAAVPTPAASESSAAAPTTAAGPTTPTAPSPTAAPTTPPAPVNGPKVFHSVPSGLCLGLESDQQQAKAQLAPCTGGPEQQWVASQLGPDVVALTVAAYGQCLDVEGASTDDGAKLQQYPCHGQGNQQWRLTPVGNGAVLLVAGHSGKCAQAEGAGTQPGTKLVQAPCTGAPEQQWNLG